MAEEQAEVRIKLVVDDEASEAAEKLKGEVHEAGDEAGKVTEETSRLGEAAELAEASFAAMAAAGAALGAGIAAAAGMAGILADKAAEAASEGAEQKRQMAGLLALMDGGKDAFADVADYAGRTREALEEAGIASGTSAAQMVQAFDTVIRQGGLSSEKARQLTEDMAVVGKQTGIGIDTLATGFSGMERGMVSARNPLVQLIAATHVLKGNAQGVAMQLAHMQPSRQMAIGAEAIQKQAEMFKKAGQAATITDITTSLTGIREQFLQEMGNPLLAHLIPPLEKFRNFLEQHSEAISMFAKRVGETLGAFVDAAVSFTEDFRNAFAKDWPSIREDLKTAAEPFRKAWEFAVQHNIGAAIEKAAKYLADTVATQVRLFETVIDKLRSLTEAALASTPGGMEASKNMRREDETDAARKLAQMQFDPNVSSADFAAQEKKFKEIAAGLGDDVSAAAAAFEDARHRTEITAKQIDDTSGKYEGEANADQFAMIYDQAGKMHDEATQQYAANVLAGSKELAEKLIAAAPELEGGYDHLADLVSDKNEELAKELRELGRTHGGQVVQDIAPKFFNAQFTIHQDFKDADPDRVAVVFRRDIVHAAANRVSARTGTPFGL